MDLLNAAADAVPDKKEVSTDLLRGRYNLPFECHFNIEREHELF